MNRFSESFATYHAFVNRRGSLIVRRYLGESERQQINWLVREEVGTFRAKDAIDARRIAIDLRGKNA